MITLILTIIYISYIGLGLPHSLFGAAWPAISADLALSIDSASYVTMLSSGCTVVSSMFGAQLAKRIGTGTVAAVSASLAAAALLGFSFSSRLWMMCVFAVPLGLAAGASDAALNNYIALNYKAMHMNFIHCFYGVGVMASPYIMSAMLEVFDWQTGYRFVFIIQCIIAGILLFSLPLWKRVKPEEETTLKEATSAAETIEAVAGTKERLSYVSLARLSKVRLNWAMCISANAIEGVVGMWASTYLVHAHGFGESKAAGSVMFFYIGIALGRFLSGLLSTKITSGRIIKIGTVVMVLGIAILFIPVSTIAILGLLLVGLGNGPLHPNILHLTPRCFGKEISGTVMGTQMAAAYFGIMVAPPIFGFLAKQISASVLPWYLGVWLIVFSVSAVLFSKKIK